VKEGDDILRNWTDIGKHTYTSVDGLQLRTGKVYSAEIYALNSDNLQSDILNSSIRISDVIPVPTGKRKKIYYHITTVKTFHFVGKHNSNLTIMTIR
jgi:hypothetical protein